MRKLLLLVVPALLVACGSSTKTGTPTGPISGTFHGRTFTPKAIRAIVADSGADPCPPFDPLGIPTLSAKALAIEVTTAGADPAAAGTIACSDITNPVCQLHQGSQTLSIMIAKVNLAPPYTMLSLTPGTYTLYPNPLAAPVVNYTTTVGLAQASDVELDPACPATTLVASSGTVTLDSVAGPITGSVSMSFPDGGAISGTFSAPFCPEAIPSTAVCQRASLGSFCAGASCVTP